MHKRGEYTSKKAQNGDKQDMLRSAWIPCEIQGLGQEANAGLALVRCLNQITPWFLKIRILRSGWRPKGSTDGSGDFRWTDRYRTACLTFEVV